VWVLGMCVYGDEAELLKLLEYFVGVWNWGNFELAGSKERGYGTTSIK